jgi:phosphohistidine phosphatase
MRLVLLRHAKSAWDRPLADHDRPLSPRGERAAAAMHDALEEEGFAADLVLSSTAERASATARTVMEGLAPAPEYLPELYMAGPHEMLELVRSTHPSIETLVLVGHNPGTHALAVRLTGDGPNPDLPRMASKYPTGAIAEIEFECDWADVTWGTGSLTRFLRPKDLPDAGRLKL